MIDPTRLLLFLTAAVLLAVAPGPGMLYVLARSLAGGRREGVLSAFGTFLGGMVHVFAAALGVSVILARSALAFATVKYAGAGYLCFLGVRMILDARKQKDCPDEFPEAIHARPRNPLWQGVATEVLNPKTALEFHPGYLVFDGVMYTLQAGCFFTMSRSLAPHRWQRFYTTVLILIMLDMVWGGVSYFRGVHVLGWLYVDSALVVAILWLVVFINHRQEFSPLFQARLQARA